MQQATKQSFHHPHASMGAHWLKTAGIMAPLIVGEFVKDPEKRWKYTRYALAATALASEMMWTTRIKRERDECREREGVR